MKLGEKINSFSIGVFDSGFGGLAILKEIVKVLPEYNYVYLGDTARTPYGSRSQEVIYRFTLQAVKFLFQKNCYLVILACNTSSSEALRKIQQQYLPKYYPQRRVLGVLVPTAESAVVESKNKHIGIIATESTVNSGAFVRELKKLDPEVKVFQKAAPLLVPIIETGQQNSEIIKLVLDDYLQPFVKENIDTLILGCTHYDLVKEEVQKVLGGEVKIISEGKIVAEKLRDYLIRHPEIENKLGKNSIRKFFTTDLTSRFKILGKEFFGEPIQPEKIELT